MYVCVCLIVGDLETSTMKRPRSEFGVCATEKKKFYAVITLFCILYNNKFQKLYNFILLIDCCTLCVFVVLGVFVVLLCVFVVSYVYLLYFLCVFVVPYVYLLYLMCICCTMCVLLFLL